MKTEVDRCEEREKDVKRERERCKEREKDVKIDVNQYRQDRQRQIDWWTEI